MKDCKTKEETETEHTAVLVHTDLSNWVGCIFIFISF